jgi:hypothetical protein
MTQKRKLKISTEQVDLRWANWWAQLICLMMPTNLYGIAGRGTGKTVTVLANRLIDMMYDLPGAPVVWAADTFADLHKNIIPSLLEGLVMLGMQEGRDFVMNKIPPLAWRDRMYNKRRDFKQTLVFANGFNATFVSLDRPAIGAGASYVAIFGDEVKYFPEEKITNLLKAVRGFRVKYGDSPWYRSRSFMTDMPNENHIGEDNWILKMGKLNDKARILLNIRCSFVYNNTKQVYASYQQQYQAALEQKRQGIIADSELLNIQNHRDNAYKNMERWRGRWDKTRKGLDFFTMVSSYVNVDILGADWFSDEISEALEGMSANILSIIPKIEANRMFYPNLCDDNFYADGYLNEVIEQHPLGWQETCDVLKYLNMSMPLESGMDAGNMLSMVFGQRKGHELFLLKEVYSLPPAGVRQLADEFIRYFKSMRTKILMLHYDRSMNNYHRTSADMATQIKKNIERNAEGVPTGWRVILLSKGQGNISSNQEYRFFMDLLSGNLNNILFRIRIDRYNCPNLKSEMEVTLTKLAQSNGGANLIVKQKTGDKLPLARLAKESTNLTDALKYFVMRKEWLYVWEHMNAARNKE